MKLFRYCLIFLVFFVASFFMLTSKAQLFNSSVYEDVSLNDVFDRAMDSALDGIVDSVDNTTVTVRRQQCVNNFYRALYAGFAIQDDVAAQALLRCYVPVLAFVDTDGLYVQYEDYLSTGELASVWSKKYVFCKDYSTVNGSGPNDVCYYSVTYTLTDSVTVIIDNKVYEGDYSRLAEYYSKSDDSSVKAVFSLPQFNDSAKFDLYRDEAVTETLIDTLGYYVNVHNSVAQRYGIGYEFTLPESAYAEFARAVEDVSFIAVMQGYPLGAGTNTTFNRVALSGARVMQSSSYYVQRGEDGYLYYHKGSCEELTDKTIYKGTKEECALYGAMPCEECRP